ncbi:MAG: YkgJ family cysteine cluster protein [Halioglobus sp.]
MQCRTACGACCIAPSINQGFYGMPDGKPAGVPCAHLDAQMGCRLFGDPRRPALCDDFKAESLICGDSREQALRILDELEILSKPDSGESV